MSVINKKDSYQTILRTVRPVKLLEFLYESFPDRSRKSVKSLLGQKQIMIADQIVTRFDYSLAPETDVVVLKKTPRDISLRKMNLVYEDEHLIVIEKSSGLLSVAAGKGNEETAFSILKSYVKKPISRHNCTLCIVWTATPPAS